ncbi:conserved hypothetical protein [Helicobacter hepaticus ATCC 51449]|uniref:Uncharacterized protein n=1 Tax=Helicobacter hepaticus (strain ATCC 51449 / 3B1) TaxID=235279 RepID=Q7VJU7_HELHP|nr:conserved hypothetical protein [Helicobacter hepaticus ATCC 51449]
MFHNTSFKRFSKNLKIKIFKEKIVPFLHIFSF